MDPRKELAAKLKRVAELKKKAAEDGYTFTPEEVAEIGTLDAEVKSLRADIERLDAAEAALKAIADEPADDDGDQGGDEPGRKSGGAQTRPRFEGAVVTAFGQKFIESERYKAFQKAFPSGPGNGSPIDIGRVKVGSMADWYAGRKAGLTTDIANIQPIRMPTVDLVDRNRLTFLDLVSRGRTAGNFEYVQITGVTRNAAIVAESVDDTGTTPATGLKPLSDMQTDVADAKVYTYADGYDVTNQLLADAPAFATYMNQELAYSLDNVVEDKLLNGTGVSGEPKGILSTTGVQEQTYTAAAGIDDAAAMAFVKAARRAITKVTRLPGGTVDAIVLSPEMDEAIDLLQDANERFFGQGPFNAGPTTLWGRPRVTSERLVDTNAILGDFKQVALLDREGLSVMAFNQHKDYAQRNRTYVRAELRAAQVIWKPNRLVVIKPAAA
ncbi:phage major capsid protein [Rhodococcus sp. NPDC019627]|uniref:phage major capsid protein n=1 Tax=unclassified Rhodococcus (in: high G+C Gram-positive bacteria) TaxID=192944 RepID=UPI0037BB6091